MIHELLYGGSSSLSTTSSAYSTGGGTGRRTGLIDNDGGIVAEATRARKNPSEGNNECNLEQKLRCPRCGSSNTKFCYYNNYNLTQPRHFCKTCRRYWTKGGALRNVPIGGGCRKNKTSFNSCTVLMMPNTGKPKSFSPSAEGVLKAGLGNNNLWLSDPKDQSLLHHRPLQWPSPAQPQTATNDLLAFLRSTQKSPNPASIAISHQFSYPLNLLNGQTPSSGSDYPCSNILRNYNQNLPQQQQVHHHQQNGVAVQRPKLSNNSNTNSYSSSGNERRNAHVFLGNNGISASSSPTSMRPTLDSATDAVGGGSDLELWNISEVAYSAWANNDHIPAAAANEEYLCPF